MFGNSLWYQSIQIYRNYYNRSYTSVLSVVNDSIVGLSKVSYSTLLSPVLLHSRKSKKLSTNSLSTIRTIPNVSVSSISTTSSSLVSSLSPSDQQFLNALITPQQSIRLDNLLNQHGVCNRRNTRQFCRTNQVLGIPVNISHSNNSHTNQEPILLQSGSIHVIPSSVRINGVYLPYAGIPLHIAIYKPKNYIITHNLEESIDNETNINYNIYELLPPEFLLRNPLLSAIGRLDKFASGLLLFTQNGKLNQRLTNPMYHIPKHYLVEVDQPLGKNQSNISTTNSYSNYTIEDIKRIFEEGKILLPDYKYAAPAKFSIHKTNPYICKITLYEGRYHQLRRMFASIGYTVINIHRIGIGNLSLDSLGLTKEGEWKLLTIENLSNLLLSTSIPSIPETLSSSSSNLLTSVSGATSNFIPNHRKKREIE